MTEVGSAGAAQPSPRGGGYDPRDQDRSVVSVPLLERLRGTPGAAPDPTPVPVVIDVNVDFPSGRSQASQAAYELLRDLTAGRGDAHLGEFDEGGPYLLATLPPDLIRTLAARNAQASPSPIFRIWPDFEVRGLLDRSIATVKADALHAAFSGYGEGICWAVLDTGVAADHPHFARFDNVKGAPVAHEDFTGLGGETVDAHGHGTHVAGIIAGYNEAPDGSDLHAVRYRRDENGDVVGDQVPVHAISGMAPRCSVVSYKVLDDNATGTSGNILTAIDRIQQVNDYGRHLRIHGVNLSLGYDFDPKWFACGQSPLCIEVDRLVRSGVVVVVAAGNTGYAYEVDAITRGSTAAGRTLTINDPGNAALAITVGSTHRESPHLYGVSYFSSKGPTGDGRAKPDVVAPGERILSAAAGTMRADAATNGATVDYVEDSGTSMAAPHVSGVIAAFLSIRREFVGRPEQVKDVFTSTATDLGRVRDFQGSGLVDAMRAIQSV